MGTRLEVETIYFFRIFRGNVNVRSTYEKLVRRYGGYKIYRHNRSVILCKWHPFNGCLRQLSQDFFFLCNSTLSLCNYNDSSWIDFVIWLAQILYIMLYILLCLFCLQQLQCNVQVQLHPQISKPRFTTALQFRLFVFKCSNNDKENLRLAP